MQYENLQDFEKNLQLIKQIGTGSTAKVFLGEHQQTLQKFAVKLFTTPMGKSNIFKIEKEMMTGLQHPNVIKLLGGFSKLFCNFKDEYIVSDGLIMEFSNSGSLTDVVQKNQLQYQEKIAIIFQVFCAVEYIHNLNMAHNDIKLDNLTLHNDKYVKLIDFSSATKEEQKQENAQLGLLGTPGYMAPELYQITNQPVELRDFIDRQKCDIFSLGVFVMHFLMKRLPFVTVDEADYSYREIIQGDYPKFWEKNQENLAKYLQIEPEFNSTAFKSLVIDMIKHEPSQRKTVSQLIQSEFFDIVRDEQCCMQASNNQNVQVDLIVKDSRSKDILQSGFSEASTIAGLSCSGKDLQLNLMDTESGFDFLDQCDSPTYQSSKAPKGMNLEFFDLEEKDMMLESINIPASQLKSTCSFKDNRTEIVCENLFDF